MEVIYPELSVTPPDNYYDQQKPITKINLINKLLNLQTNTKLVSFEALPTNDDIQTFDKETLISFVIYLKHIYRATYSKYKYYKKSFNSTKPQQKVKYVLKDESDLLTQLINLQKQNAELQNKLSLVPKELDSTYKSIISDYKLLKQKYKLLKKQPRKRNSYLEKIIKKSLIYTNQTDKFNKLKFKLTHLKQHNQIKNLNSLLESKNEQIKNLEDFCKNDFFFIENEIENTQKRIDLIQKERQIRKTELKKQQPPIEYTWKKKIQKEHEKYLAAKAEIRQLNFNLSRIRYQKEESKAYHTEIATRARLEDQLSKLESEITTAHVLKEAFEKADQFYNVFPVVPIFLSKDKTIHNNFKFNVKKNISKNYSKPHYVPSQTLFYYQNYASMEIKKILKQNKINSLINYVDRYVTISDLKKYNSLTNKNDIKIFFANWKEENPDFYDTHPKNFDLHRLFKIKDQLVCLKQQKEDTEDMSIWETATNKDFLKRALIQNYNNIKKNEKQLNGLVDKFWVYKVRKKFC